MKTRTLLAAILAVTVLCTLNSSQAAVLSQPASASRVDLMLFDLWGGTWHDAEKSPDNGQDDLMCWAAAAANVLEWTGWADAAGITGGTDSVFAYFQDHWTDKGGLMEFGWHWWFRGTNPSEGWSGWSQVDVPGGNFAPDEDFYGVWYDRTSRDADAMEAIEQYVEDKRGIALGVYDSEGDGGHAITCWGLSYEADGATYAGIWVSDSDDDKRDRTPEDQLRHYEIIARDGKWFLQSFYGRDSWYIGEVQALGAIHAPEPGSIILLAVGSVALVWRRLRFGAVL